MNNFGKIITLKELRNLNDCTVLIKELVDYEESIGYRKTGSQSQIEAWKSEILFLKEQLSNSKLSNDVRIIFEYMLPNENTQRPDVILLFKAKVIVLEFKTGGNKVTLDYVAQFMDYQSILKTYHIVVNKKNMDVESYLVMCDYNTCDIVFSKELDGKIDENDKKRILGKDTFGNLVNKMEEVKPLSEEEVVEWVNGQRVRGEKIWEIGKRLEQELKDGTKYIYSKISSIPYQYLHATQDKIFDLVKKDEKNIIFVSGVPGAGKTMIGLITLFGCHGEHMNARYYTGNGALQNVLSETLSEKSEASKNSEIQLLSSFRNNYENSKFCEERVLIFDEAQRFWEENYKINCSDQELILNRVKYPENASIICLIGDGQRPGHGEGGIEAWVEALKKNPSWKVYVPRNYIETFKGVKVERVDELFLDTSLRNHFIDYSKWVELVLAGDAVGANNELTRLKNEVNVKIKIVRSLSKLYEVDNSGKSIVQKLKKKRDGMNKDSNDKYLYGVLCSSKNEPSRVENLSGGKIRKIVPDYKDAHNWYKGDRCNLDNGHINIGTEMFTQGLELDLPILFFGGDYYIENKNGKYQWAINVSTSIQRKYGKELSSIMQDTYRILLTRATEEMILVIPEDPSLDQTYEFFKAAGVEEYEMK